MKRKCMIFPFSKHALGIIKNKDNIEEYEINFVSSLPGWINGFERIIIENKLEIININCFDKLNSVDVVIIPPLLDVSYLSVISKCIQQLVEKQIEIINLSGCSFNDNTREISSEQHFLENDEEQLYDIKSCVIWLSQVGEYCNIEQLEVLLQKSFVDLGIKTKIISSSWHSELFGFIKFPQFMYEKNIDEKSKVKKFNQFIHNIENDGTELIIISLSEPVLCYPNSLTTSEHAYRQYLSAKGCPPDYTIFCVYAKRYLKKEIVELKNKYIKSVGVDLNLMVMSEMSIDWIAFNDIEINKTIYFSLKSSTVENFSADTTKNSNVKIVPVNNIDFIVGDILNMLSPQTHGYMLL